MLKASSLQPELKILAISEVVKGLAPQASVWCGGECAHAYPVKSLAGGSYNRFDHTNQPHTHSQIDADRNKHDM